MSVPEDPRIPHCEMGIWGDQLMFQCQAYLDKRSQEGCRLEMTEKTVSLRTVKRWRRLGHRLPDVSLDTPNEYLIIPCESFPSHISFNGIPNLRAYARASVWVNRGMNGITCGMEFHKVNL